MHTYEIEVPGERERGVVVRCPAHDKREELQPGRSGGAFYCPECGYEVDFTVHDTFDWRDWGEMC
jgi:hypothetical protein